MCQEVLVRDCQNKLRRVWSLVPKTQTKEESDLQCSQVQRQVCNSNSSDEVLNDIPEELCTVQQHARSKHDYSRGDGEEAADRHCHSERVPWM